MELRFTQRNSQPFGFVLWRTDCRKIVFGHERITSGADDDIAKATFFLNSMLKEHGMGNRMAAINARSIDARFYHDDFDMQLEVQAREWMDAAMSLARNLRQHKLLLMMRPLSDTAASEG